jgi:hypothetical protein
MKTPLHLLPLLIFGFGTLNSAAQTSQGAAMNDKKLYMDIHQLEPGKVTVKDVAAAHAKDLAVEKKYGVHFINYWVDEEQGLIYCLSSASDTSSIRKNT